jgi:alkanesulfonate monooxygenase SsuD/methylene tetrahydromethanopterin reductase-like flavin-dependent oxidoreductase (luciferase family)
MRERFDALESAIDRIRQTWAMSNPKPARGEVPLLVGGRGLKRTVPLAARVATEWNMFATDPGAYTEASQALDQAARDAGREPSEIRRSVMAVACVGRTRDEARERANELKMVIPRFRDSSADEVLDATTFGGTADEVAAKMRPWIAAGVQLFMLQHFLLDDPDHLAVLAEVAQQVA